MAKIRRQGNVDCIRYSKIILKYFRTNGCRKWRNAFNIENFIVLAEDFGHQTDCSNYIRKVSQSRNALCTRGGISHIHLSLSSKWKPCHGAIISWHVISKWNWKSTFDFTKIVNNYGLKQGTVCQIAIFISQFSLNLQIQFWKFIHSLILGSVGRC